MPISSELLIWKAARIFHLMQFGNTTPKSNHKNCMRNYFDLLKITVNGKRRSLLPEKSVLVTENGQIPLNNAWVWKAAPSAPLSTAKGLGLQLDRGIAATKKVGKVAATKIITGGSWGSKLAAKDGGARTERMVLKQNGRSWPTAAHIHKMSQNQSQELLICIGYGMNK